MQSDFITDYHNNRSTKGGKVAKTISFAVLALFGIVGYAGYKSGSTQVHNTQL